MSELLTSLLAAGLIEKLDGDDERFGKLEKASAAVAKELRDRPADLIRAMLAGLDPDTPADDPALVQANRALVAEWKSVSSIHTDMPIGLLRAIILDACSQAGDGKNAAVLWLTAADTLPLRRLGKEESVVRSLLETMAQQAEVAALVVPEVPTRTRRQSRKVEAPAPAKALASRAVDRKRLLTNVAWTAGPNYRGQASPDNPNPHWTNSPQNWSWDFADRMSSLLADELDALAAHMGKVQAHHNGAQAELAKEVDDALTAHRQWMDEAFEAHTARQQTDRLRVNALWWSKALYSKSLRRGYREMTPVLAAVVMAVDLLAEVTKPAPASVGYLLAESIHGLPGAAFDEKLPVRQMLEALREARERIPTEWTAARTPPPSAGRLSLRDLVVLALSDREWDVDLLLRRAGVRADVGVSAPDLGHAMFRQEQAVQLAGGSA